MRIAGAGAQAILVTLLLGSAPTVVSITAVVAAIPPVAVVANLEVALTITQHLIRSDLEPNTFEYEMQPLITQNGFREYDARWLFGKELNLMGVQYVGLGLGTVFIAYPVLQTILKWGGIAYLVWTRQVQGSGAGIDHQVVFSASTDRGATWSAPVMPVSSNSESFGQIAPLSNAVCLANAPRISGAWSGPRLSRFAGARRAVRPAAWGEPTRGIAAQRHSSMEARQL